MILNFLFQNVMTEISGNLESIYFLFKIVAIVALGFALINLFFFIFKLFSTNDLKKKYDYINQHEIKFLWRSSLLLIISGSFSINTLILNTEPIWVAVRIFITVMLSLIIGVSIFNILKFYYPFFIEKRLKKLRYTPRISAKSGLPMVLLSEEEEDAFLDEGMQAEENAFSIDYDVWECKTSGDIKIEKYVGHLHAEQCPSCNYQTLKIVKEEIVEKPSATQDGLLLKYYKCNYCGHKVKRDQHLKLSTSLNVGPGKDMSFSDTTTV